MRFDTSGLKAYGYSLQLPTENPLPFNFSFMETVLHEARHLWQFRLKGQQGNDSDGDGLVVLAPESAKEMLDSGHIDEGGANPDFHFTGDGIGLYDSDAGLSWERDALRFSANAAGIPYACIVESPPVVVSAPATLQANGDSTLLVVQTNQRIGDISYPLGGLSVKWWVANGSCELDCGDPCFTTSKLYLYEPGPDNGLAGVAVSSTQAGECTINFKILPAVNPPAGPTGTTDCTAVDALGTIVVDFIE